jgi:DNA repair exonuclease SbcCD ATPase subunit
MLKPKVFYEDGATPPDDGSNGAPTTLTYNYAGDEITVDLSNPESVKLAQDRLSKGHNMEKIAEERNKLKAEAEKLQQTVDAWNQRLENAKNDPQEFTALITDLEEYIGKPLTQQQKTDLATDANLDVDDPVTKELLSLKNEFATYKEQQEKQAKDREIQVEAKQLVAKLDAMEKDTEKYPGFNRDKVYEAAKDAGTTDFEMVYFYLNRDAFLETERKKIEEEFKQLTDKRKAAATEGDATAASLQEPPKTFKKIEDVGRAVMEEVKKGNISLFD